LRSLQYSGQSHRGSIHRFELNDAHLVVHIQHVGQEEIIETVPVDICKIHGHRKGAGIAQSHRRDGAKAAPSIVQPNTIRSNEVIADVQVGRTVAVKVAKGGGESPIP
jgi:hypothetical protein